MVRAILSLLLLSSAALSVSSSGLSFTELDQWLSKNVPQSTGPTASFEAALKHFKIDVSPNTAPVLALKALDSLSKVTRCDDRVLETLRKIEPALTSNSKRVERIVVYLVNGFYAACEGYLDFRVDNLYSQLDRSKVGPLLRQLKPEPRDFAPANMRGASGESFFLTYLGRPGLGKGDRSDAQLANDVVQLSEGAEIASESQFALAFKKHLAEPCEYYNQVMGDLLEGAYALKLLGQLSKRANNFISDRPAPFKDALYYYKTCYKVTGLKKDELAQMFYLAN